VQGGSSPKLLTENQVLGKHIHARPEPANDDLSHLRRLPGLGPLGKITQTYEGTHQIQRIVIPAPCSATSSPPAVPNS
jgi:hypothetical protein